MDMKYLFAGNYLKFFGKRPIFCVSTIYVLFKMLGMVLLRPTILIDIDFISLSVHQIIFWVMHNIGYNAIDGNCIGLVHSPVFRPSCCTCLPIAQMCFCGCCVWFGVQFVSTLIRICDVGVALTTNLIWLTFRCYG